MSSPATPTAIDASDHVLPPSPRRLQIDAAVAQPDLVRVYPELVDDAQQQVAARVVRRRLDVTAAFDRAGAVRATTYGSATWLCRFALPMPLP